MRRSWLLLLIWIGPAFGAVAGLLPLTAGDVGLMLRSGYSSAAVMRELDKRHLLAPIEPDQRTALVKAGASAELIAALEEGKYALSEDDSAKAQEQMTDLAERRAAASQKEEQARARLLEQRQRETSVASQQSLERATSDFLKGYLVRCRNGSVVAASDDAVDRKKYILYYYGASWSAPARKFTPKLVEYYNRVTEKHPEVEVVYYSFDRSAGDMENFMRDSNMPWPAVDYAKREEKQALARGVGDGLPSLVLVENTGKMLSKSVVEGKSDGTDKVLADLDALLAGQTPRVAAQAH